ncbi:hypothetical protein DVK06_11950 [Halorubrum sp. Atlit-28R]|nr:hypothetical protein DVK06_11950 [Halorubrum sp. Atlit-28R]
MGTALTGTGAIALGGQLTVVSWITNRLARAAMRGVVIFGSLVLAIGGGTLLLPHFDMARQRTRSS